MVVLALAGGVILPRYVRTWSQRHEAENRATLEADLRNLATAEDAYFKDAGTYSGTPGHSFAASEGVTLGMDLVTQSGWSATARKGSVICGVFAGDVPPKFEAKREREPVCLFER